jgi:hypothetical protein
LGVIFEVYDPFSSSAPARRDGAEIEAEEEEQEVAAAAASAREQGQDDEEDSAEPRQVLVEIRRGKVS